MLSGKLPVLKIVYALKWKQDDFFLRLTMVGQENGSQSHWLQIQIYAIKPELET